MASNLDWLNQPYNNDGQTNAMRQSFIDSGKYYNPSNTGYAGAGYVPSTGNGNRSALDRMFDVMQVGMYTVQGGIHGALDPNQSVGQGMLEGLKAGNPFGAGNTQGEYKFSDNLGLMGWNPTSTGGKVLKGVAGFAGDVLLDPLTYINPLSIGGNAIFKGTGTKVGKEVVEKFTPDMAEAILKKMNGGVIPEAKDTLDLVRRTNLARGIVEEGTGKGFGLYGSNIPFANKLGIADKKIEFISEAKLRAFGDATFAPFVNKAGDNLLHSKVGSMFSTKADLLDVARKDPESLVKMFQFAKNAGEANYTYKEAISNLTDKYKEFSALPKESQIQINNMLENKKLWEGLTTYKPLTDMKAGADLHAVIQKYVQDFGMDDAKLKQIMDEITPKFGVGEKATLRFKGVGDTEAIIDKAMVDSHGNRFYKIQGYDKNIPESAFVDRSVLASEQRTAYRKAQTDHILNQKASMDAGDTGRINLSNDNIGVDVNGKSLTSDLDNAIERGEIVPMAEVTPTSTPSEVAVTKVEDTHPDVINYKKALEESNLSKSTLEQAKADLIEAEKLPYKDTGNVKGNAKEIDRLNKLIKDERIKAQVVGKKLEQASANLPEGYSANGLKQADSLAQKETAVSRLNDGSNEHLVNTDGEKTKLVSQYEARKQSKAVISKETNSTKAYYDKSFLSENISINREGQIINHTTGEKFGNVISGRKVLNNDKPLNTLMNIKGLGKNFWKETKTKTDNEIRAYFEKIVSKDPVVKDMFSSFKATGQMNENPSLYVIENFIDAYYNKSASKFITGAHLFNKNYKDVLPILARDTKFGDYSVLMKRNGVTWKDYIEKAGIDGAHVDTAGLPPLPKGLLESRMKRMYELFNNPKEFEMEKAITLKNAKGTFNRDVSTDVGTAINKADKNMAQNTADRFAQSQKDAGVHGYINADESAIGKSVEGANYIIKNDAGGFVQKTQATRWNPDGTPTHVMYNYKGKSVEVDVRQLEQKGFNLSEAKPVNSVTGTTRVMEPSKAYPGRAKEETSAMLSSGSDYVSTTNKKYAEAYAKATPEERLAMDKAKTKYGADTVAPTGHDSIDSLDTLDEMTYGLDTKSLSDAIDPTAKVGNAVPNAVDDNIAKLYEEQARLAKEAKVQAEIDSKVADIFADEPLVTPKTTQQINDEAVNAVGNDSISKSENVIQDKTINESITDMQDSVPTTKPKRTKKAYTVTDAINKLPNQMDNALTDVGAKSNDVRIMLNNLTQYRKALESEANFETYAKQIWSTTKFKDLEAKRAITTFNIDKPDLYDADIVAIAKGIRADFKSVQIAETAIGQLDSHLLEGYSAHILDPSYRSPLEKLTPQELEDMGIKIPKNSFNKGRKYQVGDVMPNGKKLEFATVQEINDAHKDFAIQLNKKLITNGRDPVEVKNLFMDEISDIYVKRMESHYKLMYDDAVYGDITKKFGTQYGGKAVKPEYADGMDAFLRGDAKEMEATLSEHVSGIDSETLKANVGKPVMGSTVLKDNHSLVVSNAELKKQLAKMAPEERLARMESYGLSEEDLNKLGNSFIRVKSEVADKMNADGIASVHQVPNVVLDKAESLAHVQMAKDTHGLLGAYDKFLRTYKLAVTAYRPAFHMNNLKGNTFNNYLDVGSKAMSPRLWQSGYDILKKNEGSIYSSLYKKDISYEEILREMTIQGKIGSGFFGKDVKAVVEKQLLDAQGSKQTLKNAFQLPQRLGSSIEDHGKVVNFIANLELGKSFTEAGEHVDKFLFDYGDLTKFEHEVMQRIVPFYTWMRKNTPLQLEQMLTNPKRYAPVAKAISELKGMTNEDGRIDSSKVPAFARDWVQLPFNITNESGNQEALMWSNGLPYLDINKIPDIFNLSDSATNLFESSSPAIRMPIELATNKNYFFGSKIDNGKNVLDPSGQFEISPQLNYVLSQIPQIAEPGGFVRKTGIDKLIHLMDKGLGSGIKSYDTADGMVQMNQAIQTSNAYNANAKANVDPSSPGDYSNMNVEPGKFKAPDGTDLNDLWDNSGSVSGTVGTDSTMTDKVKARNASLK